MTGSLRRRPLTAATVLALVAGAFVLTPQAAGAAVTYHVQGTDGVLARQSKPFVDNVVGTLHEGDAVSVQCQINDGGADPYDGLASRTWDLLTDGSWVYDWFISTPRQGTDGWSPGVDHCAYTTLPTYKVHGTDGTLAVQQTPHVDNLVRWLHEGDTVTIACQTNSGGTDPYDGLTSRTWDKLFDGTWVYDWFITTPPQGGDGFSPGIPQCAPTTGPAPGLYKVSGTDGTLAVQSQPATGHVVGSLKEGQSVTVQCQVNNGGTDAADGLTSRTWDKIGTNQWVYDWFVSTPVQGADGFSPGIAHCDSGNPPTNDGSSAFVALGDSYSAGMGTYDHTGFPNDPCSRSPKTYSVTYATTHTLPAWLGQVTPKLLACSGATSNDMFIRYNGQPPQINWDSNLNRTPGALGLNTRLVTLTIGGNDVGFASILAACLGPGILGGGDGCWKQQLDDADAFISDPQGLQSNLTWLYGAVKRIAPKAHIVVLTYPDGFPPSIVDCQDSLGVGGQMSQASLDHIHATTRNANAVIKLSAAIEGVSVLDEQGRFANHDFCQPQSQRYLNGLRYNNRDHQVTDGGSHDNESYHPTVAGYVQEANDLAAYVASHWG